LSILQLVNVARPDEALRGLVWQVRMAPAGVVMVRVTEALLLVTVEPFASWTVTTGWVAKLVLLAAPEGLVVKASLVAVPAIVKLLLRALVSPVAAAVKV